MSNCAFHLKSHMSSLRLTTIKTVVHRRNLGLRRLPTINLLGKSLRVSHRSPRYLQSIGGIWERRGHSTVFRGITPLCNRRALMFNLKFYREQWSIQTCTRNNKLPIRIEMGAIWYRTINTPSIKPLPTIIMFNVTRHNLAKRNNVVNRARSIIWNTRPGNRIKPEPLFKSFVGWNGNSRKTLQRAPAGNTFTSIFIITIIIITRRRLFDSFFVRGTFAQI